MQVTFLVRFLGARLLSWSASLQESFSDGDYSLAAWGPSRDENPRAEEASFSVGSSEVSLSRFGRSFCHQPWKGLAPLCLHEFATEGKGEQCTAS